MKKIYIKKKYLEDSFVTDYAFTIMAALQPYSNNRNDMLLTAEYVSYLVFGREATRKELYIIKAGLEELIESGIIKVNYKLNKSQFVCDISNLYFRKGTEYFVTVEYDELHKIINIETKSDKYKLFRYFCSIVGHFNLSGFLDEEYRGKVCGYALNEINELIPKRTAIRYNEILEENQLIHIHRYDDVLYNTIDNELKRIVNVYGRYKDKDIVEKFAKVYEEKYGWDHINERKKSEHKVADRNRALGQYYKNYINGKEYDKETVEEILQWAIKKEKDLTVFIENEIIESNDGWKINEDDIEYDGENYGIKI